MSDPSGARMAVAMTPSHEDTPQPMDWEELLAAARRLLRARMRGFSAHDIEDAVQEFAAGWVKFEKKNGPPDHPEGLLVRIVRAVAANAIACRQRERALARQDIRAWLGEGGSPDDDVVEQYQVIVFHVREYFRLKRAGCVPLADAKSQGESLKDYAARLEQSYEKIRQAWSRCVRLIHEAMRRKRLRLEWPTPRKPKGSDE